MSQNKSFAFFWRKVLIPFAFILLLCVVGFYLYGIFMEESVEKFVSSLVLISSLLIGVAHILLYIARRTLEEKNTTEAKKKKRYLEKYRNIVNYITPFVLVAMLYHFWEKGWVLASIIIVVLLLDRLNDLLRRNK